MKSQIAQASLGSIEYTLLGSGPVVLICHGTSSNCFSTDIVDPLVQAGFSVLTPSRPGYGCTLLSVGPSAAGAAEALVALLDSLQIPTCDVVAISGGGPTGLALAAGFPQRVKRLVLAAAISHPENRPNEPSYKNRHLHSLMYNSAGDAGPDQPLLAAEWPARHRASPPMIRMTGVQASRKIRRSGRLPGHSPKGPEDNTHNVGRSARRSAS
jgi:pimeloyl-ACP methyl ester carboxylesterase